MKDKNEFYLVVVSILLASSLLKSTEIFQLGGQLNNVLFSEPSNISIKVIGAYLFLATFFLFFFFAGMTMYGLVWQISKAESIQNPPDLGMLVNISIILLISSHLIAFAFMVNTLKN